MATDPRERPIKRLQICPKCAGYMQPLSSFPSGAGKRDWKDETFHRSFGGVELRKFVCEKCHHVATFQVDDLADLGEDD
ncbi:MAG: hypothetical protein AAB426_05165 [Myxococcota bacterium]